MQTSLLSMSCNICRTTLTLSKLHSDHFDLGSGSCGGIHNLLRRGWKIFHPSVEGLFCPLIFLIFLFCVISVLFSHVWKQLRWKEVLFLLLMKNGSLEDSRWMQKYLMLNHVNTRWTKWVLGEEEKRGKNTKKCLTLCKCNCRKGHTMKVIMLTADS